MNLQNIIEDIHILTEDVKVYERKYGILSETFYEIYSKGIEPESDDWVADWSEWAGALKILCRRKDEYRNAIKALMEYEPESVIKAARHEQFSIAS